jgi:hypothetical protein
MILPVGLYSHTLVRTIVALPFCTHLNPRPRHLRVLAQALFVSRHIRPACRLSSRSQRLPASFHTCHHPQTGPTVPLPVLAVFPNLDSEHCRAEHFCNQAQQIVTPPA